MKFLVFILLSTSTAILAQSDRCPPGYLFTGSACYYYEQVIGPEFCNGQNKSDGEECLRIMRRKLKDLDIVIKPFACKPKDEDCCKEITGIQEGELEQRSCQNCGFRIDLVNTSFIRSKDLCVKPTPNTEKTTCAVTPAEPTTQPASNTKLNNEDAIKNLISVMRYYSTELEFDQSTFDVLSGILQAVILEGSKN